VPKSFINLCDSQFNQFYISCNCGLIEEYLKCITLHFRLHLVALFLFDVFKRKVNCHSIMDSVCVPPELIRDISTFALSSCVFDSNMVLLEDILSLHNYD
jgi:hypothetical protein